MCDIMEGDITEFRVYGRSTIMQFKDAPFAVNVIAPNYLNIIGYKAPRLRDLGFRLGAFRSYSLVVFTLKNHP